MSRFLLISLIVTVLSLALAGGCTDDMRDRKLFDAGAGEAEIRYTVENISLTRADGERDMESFIDHAYLLFYASDATVETAIPIAAVKATVSESNSAALSFKMPLSLNADTDYRLVAVANADSYTPEGYTSFAEYLQRWSGGESADRRELLLYHGACILASNSGCLPMRGHLANDAPFRFSMQNGSYSVSASLSFRRAVGRIDVTNLVKSGFKVEGVALCNWRDAASAVLEEGQLGNRVGTVNGILSDEEHADPIFSSMPAAEEDGIQRLQEAIYCFPSVAYDSHASDTESVSLIIKAKYGDDAEPSYYRVNINVNGNQAEVKANTKYLVAIQSVKGRGASTPEEAYAATESSIVLSVVEDWDLDGSFDMDEDGNFIVLSTGKLEFDGDSEEKKVVKVLTSKGLSWTANYISDNDDSASSFSASSLSDGSLAIGPTGVNDGETALSGKFVVSATTPQGGSLSVDIRVVQNPAEENQPVEPVVPSDMPFALIPQSYERVTIDHEKRTIEIDGFDPDCFNSFIDIPFKVYVNPSLSSGELTISSSLIWPVEGAVSKVRENDYYYCSNSFVVNQPKVYAKSKGKELFQQEAIGLVSNISFEIKKDDVVYVSIGAMGPDDPAIVRSIIILDTSTMEKIEYALTVKPRQAIIDDVVISDDNGSYWLVCDRNVQDINSNHDYVKRKSDGSKYQAYNFLAQNPVVSIPFKFGVNGNPASEGQHTLYRGVTNSYGDRSNNIALKTNWLQGYAYTEGHTLTSPYYEATNINQWDFPKVTLMQIISQRMSVSKLRMFLVSDIPVKSGRNKIPVCCYLPYNGDSSEVFSVSEYSCGYFAVNDSGVLNSLVYILCNRSQMKIEIPSLSNKNNGYPGLMRLVRPLTPTELEAYKKGYLGYGSEPHRLKICHPDTYESASLGWIPN